MKKLCFIAAVLVIVSVFLVSCAKEQAPAEIKDFFAEVYPEIKHYKDISPMVRSAGYEFLDFFPLPDESWWTDYYTPAENKIAELRQKYSGDDAKQIFDSFQLEMDMHRKYCEYYGYGFYIMQKE